MNRFWVPVHKQRFLVFVEDGRELPMARWLNMISIKHRRPQGATELRVTLQVLGIEELHSYCFILCANLPLRFKINCRAEYAKPAGSGAVT